MLIRVPELAEIRQLNAVEASASEAFLSLPGYEFVGSYPLPEEAVYAPFVDDRRAFACVVGEVLAGYVLMGEVDGRGHVMQVSVRSDFQRQGLGRQLVQAGEAWAFEQGFRAVTLTTFRDVAWNAPAYERLGYVIMPEGTEGGGIAAILASERAIGLFQQARVAMIKQL